MAEDCRCYQQLLNASCEKWARGQYMQNKLDTESSVITARNFSECCPSAKGPAH